MVLSVLLLHGVPSLLSLQLSAGEVLCTTNVSMVTHGYIVVAIHKTPPQDIHDWTSMDSSTHSNDFMDTNVSMNSL